MGPEQGQQQSNFFLRTDLNTELDHVFLLFAPLVGSNSEGVQDDLVSGLFRECFVVMRSRGDADAQPCCQPMIAPTRHSSEPNIVPTICIQYRIGMVSR